jgi:hypothetical protein
VSIGGFLCALGLARRGALFGFVALGILLLSAEAGHAWAKGPRWPVRRRRLLLLAADAPFLAAAAAISALGALRAFCAILTNRFNPNDDLLAYFQFAREILERGTLTQPFSLRRISAYSGKSLLDAMQLAIDVPETHLHLLDKGLATLTVLGLVFGHARSSRRTGRSMLLLAMLFVVALPDPGINTSSLMTGVVFFLGLYRTMSWAPVAEAHGLRAALPVALLAAGACTLRQNYLATIAAMLVFAYAPPLVQGLRLRPLRLPRTPLADAAMAAGLLVGLLFPWWALSLRWCGSFLYPAMKGNYNPAYSFFPSRAPLDWLQYFWANATYNNPIKAVPIFLVAAATMRDRTPRAPLGALMGAAFFGFAMLVWSYPAALTGDQSRYYFGFTLAAVLALGLKAADLSALRSRARWRTAACVPLVALGFAMQLYEERDHLASTYKGFLGQLGRSSGRWVRSVPDPVFQALQRPVPEGAPIATLVDDPSHFDHRRNRIACLDMIGGVSPKPGIPLAGGGEAVAAYLLDQGYRYLVVIRHDAARSLYRRDIWVKQQKESDPVWMASAHFYLEAFDDFDELRRTRVHLADAGNMTTLDLGARSP